VTLPPGPPNKTSPVRRNSGRPGLPARLASEKSAAESKDFGPSRRAGLDGILSAVAHLLVVDDDADSREALSRILRRRGYRATSVPNGREALAVLTSSTPDLIVLDLRMPQMDGIMFLDVVRSYLRLQHIPVFILTAYPESADLSRAESLGVRGTFTKGEGDLNKLIEAIQAEVGPPPPPRTNGSAGPSHTAR
jgi:CheY-like chemotaxis protein